MIVGYKLIWTGTDLKDVPIWERREMEVKAPKVKKVVSPNHDHIVCPHELKYCEVCDVVHCQICGKEWTEKWSGSYTTIPYSYHYTTC